MVYQYGQIHLINKMTYIKTTKLLNIQLLLVKYNKSYTKSPVDVLLNPPVR